MECKKAQPKEVMFPTVLANSRVAARTPNGELVFLSPSAPYRPFDAHSAAPRVSDILKPEQSRHFNTSDLYDAVQSECFVFDRATHAHRTHTPHDAPSFFADNIMLGLGGFPNGSQSAYMPGHGYSGYPMLGQWYHPSGKADSLGYACHVTLIP